MILFAFFASAREIFPSCSEWAEGCAAHPNCAFGNNHFFPASRMIYTPRAKAAAQRGENDEDLLNIIWLGGKDAGVWGGKTFLIRCSFVAGNAVVFLMSRLHKTRWKWCRAKNFFLYVFFLFFLLFKNESECKEEKTQLSEAKKCIKRNELFSETKAPDLAHFCVGTIGRG